MKSNSHIQKVIRFDTSRLEQRMFSVSEISCTTQIHSTPQVKHVYERKTYEFFSNLEAKL